MQSTISYLVCLIDINVHHLEPGLNCQPECVHTHVLCYQWTASKSVLGGFPSVKEPSSYIAEPHKCEGYHGMQSQTKCPAAKPQSTDTRFTPCTYEYLYLCVFNTLDATPHLPISKLWKQHWSKWELGQAYPHYRLLAVANTCAGKHVCCSVEFIPHMTEQRPVIEQKLIWFAVLC